MGKENHKKKSMDWPPKTAPKVVGTAQHTGRLVNEPQWRSGGLRRAKRWKNVSTGPIKMVLLNKKSTKSYPKSASRLSNLVQHTPASGLASSSDGKHRFWAKNNVSGKKG
jgi:hypothetical protein